MLLKEFDQATLQFFVVPEDEPEAVPHLASIKNLLLVPKTGDLVFIRDNPQMHYIEASIKKIGNFSLSDRGLSIEFFRVGGEKTEFRMLRRLNTCLPGSAKGKLTAYERTSEEGEKQTVYYITNSLSIR